MLAVYLLQQAYCALGVLCENCICLYTGCTLYSSDLRI